jgi:hypothetical protein
MESWHFIRTALLKMLAVFDFYRTIDNRGIDLIVGRLLWR